MNFKIRNNILAKTLVAAFFFTSSMEVGCSQQNFGLEDQNQQFSAGVSYNSKVDILMMVDNSSSMAQYHSKFAAQVPAMLSQLNSAGLDYHIAIVTSDMRAVGSGGRFIGSPKYLTPSTPNLVSVLQSRIAVGETGSDLERGLDSLQTALSPSYLASEGAGFLRSDALLAMVVITNEDDYSSGSTASYSSFFDQLKPPFKGTTKAWLMNFIGVVSLGGACSTTADFKEAGLRYMNLADATGGIKESVCSASLATAVSNLRVRIVEILSEYTLDRVPVVASISVSINGVTIPQDATNGWTYNAATNSVRFHGTSLPGAYDQVKVSYTPAGGT